VPGSFYLGGKGRLIPPGFVLWRSAPDRRKCGRRNPYRRTHSPPCARFVWFAAFAVLGTNSVGRPRRAPHWLVGLAALLVNLNGFGRNRLPVGRAAVVGSSGTCSQRAAAVLRRAPAALLDRPRLRRCRSLILGLPHLLQHVFVPVTDCTGRCWSAKTLRTNTLERWRPSTEKTDAGKQTCPLRTRPISAAAMSCPRLEAAAKADSDDAMRRVEFGGNWLGHSWWLQGQCPQLRDQAARTTARRAIPNSTPGRSGGI